ncbi:oxaloacetate decarboxylase gamma chain [Pillotina sp. SPG140]
MFGQSAILTLLGMGTVFSFLILLIIVVTVLGKVVQVFGWNKDTIKSVTAAQQTVHTATTPDVIPAVITAAVSEYRKTNP